MRRFPFCTVAAVTMSLASAARGDLLFSATDENLGNGYDRRMYFIRNDGTNGTGTRVTSSDVTLSSEDQRINFVIKFVNSSATAKADLTGTALYEDSDEDPSALFHSDRTFVNLLGNWNSSTTDPTGYLVTSTNPPNQRFNYVGNVTRLEVSGAYAGGVDATAAVNYGLGALMAVAVVPWSDPRFGPPITIYGTVGTETGVSQEFFFGSPNLFPPLPPPPSFPEPAGALAIGTLLLMRRQRRTRSLAVG